MLFFIQGLGSTPLRTVIYLCAPPPHFMFCEYVMKDLVATTAGMQWLKCLASMLRLCQIDQLVWKLRYLNSLKAFTRPLSDDSRTFVHLINGALHNSDNILGHYLRHNGKSTAVFFFSPEHFTQQPAFIHSHTFTNTGGSDDIYSFPFPFTSMSFLFVWLYMSPQGFRQTLLAASTIKLLFINNVYISRGYKHIKWISVYPA